MSFTIIKNKFKYFSMLVYKFNKNSALRRFNSQTFTIYVQYFNQV